MPLVSVEMDPDTEGAGELVASQRNMMISGKPVILQQDHAFPDDVWIEEHISPHDDPYAVQGSPTMFVGGKPVHRMHDLRICGATTVVQGQTKMFINEGGGAAPTSSIFKNMTPEPIVTISSSQRQTFAGNIANISKYNTPDNIANGVDKHPELEDDPSSTVTPTPAAVTNPNCVGGGDMGAQLDQVMNESRQGVWRETGNNPNIIALYKNVGIPQQSDSVAWCAAFVGSTLKKNCYKFNKSLAAGSYTNYGNPVPGGITNAQRGDVLIFNRSGGTGHVAFYDGPGPTPGTIYVIGGNQSNNVTRSVRAISGLKTNGVQRPIPS